MREHRRGRKHCWTEPQQVGFAVGYIAWNHVVRRGNYQRKHWACTIGLKVPIEWYHRKWKVPNAHR